jgi:hypothetical protein
MNEQKQQELLKAIVSALAQGMAPEKLIESLSSKGMPQEAATQFVKLGIGYVEKMQTQQPPQQQMQPNAGEAEMMQQESNGLPNYNWGAAASSIAQNPQAMGAIAQMAPQVMNMMGGKGGGQGGGKPQQPSVPPALLDQFVSKYGGSKKYQAGTNETEAMPQTEGEMMEWIGQMESQGYTPEEINTHPWYQEHARRAKKVNEKEAVNKEEALQRFLDRMKGFPTGSDKMQFGGHLTMHNALHQNPSELDTVASIRPNAIKGMMHGSGSSKTSKDAITIKSDISKTQKLRKFARGGFDDYNKDFYSDIEDNVAEYNEDPNRSYYVDELSYKNRGWLGRLFHPNNPQKKVSMSFAPKQGGNGQMTMEQYQQLMQALGSGDLPSDSPVGDNIGKTSSVSSEGMVDPGTGESVEWSQSSSNGLQSTKDRTYTGRTQRGVRMRRPCRSCKKPRTIAGEEVYNDDMPTIEQIEAEAAANQPAVPMFNTEPPGMQFQYAKNTPMGTWQDNVSYSEGDAPPAYMDHSYTDTSSPSFTPAGESSSSSTSTGAAASSGSSGGGGSQRYGGLHKFLPKAQFGENQSFMGPMKQPSVAASNITNDQYIDDFTTNASNTGTPITWTPELIDMAKDKSSRDMANVANPDANAGVAKANVALADQLNKNYTATTADVEGAKTGKIPDAVTNRFDVDQVEGAKGVETSDVVSGENVKKNKKNKMGDMLAHNAGNDAFLHLTYDKPWKNILAGFANIGVGMSEDLSSISQAKKAKEQFTGGKKQEGGFTPHIMFNPSTGGTYYADTLTKHKELSDKGWVHDEMRTGGTLPLPKYQGLGASTVAGGMSGATLDTSQMSNPGGMDWAGMSTGNPDMIDPQVAEFNENVTMMDENQMQDMPVASDMDMQELANATGPADTTDSGADQQKEKKQEDTAGASLGSGNAQGWRTMEGITQVVTGLEQLKEKKKRKKRKNKTMAAGNSMGYLGANTINTPSQGLGVTNQGIGPHYKLNQHTYADPGYGYYVKFGGLSKFVGGGSYKTGDEVYMTKKQMDDYIRMGGVVEIIEDDMK